jgi:hypothetical protein
MSETERLQIEVTIAAPIDAVWRAFREPTQLRRWHGWDDPSLDEEIQIIYLDEDNITVSEADHTLVLGGDRFELTDLGGRTLVRLTRGPRGSNPEWDAYYEDINEGWQSFLQQLRFALERHLGVDRRTLFFSGERRDDVEPITQLAPAAAPTPITGTMWFRSEHQVGFTVDEWGDGLLVLGEAPVSPNRPQGGDMAILTTYGLADSSFEALRSKWTDWWRAHHREDEPVPTE